MIIMRDMIQRLTFSGFVFIIGVSIGTIYTPEVITFSKNMDDINQEKQELQNKSKPLHFKTSKKKRFA